MKDTSNLFFQWKHGQFVLPKVYIVRIYYTDNSGNAQTCLKLGFTKQLLHNCVINFLNEMRKATGFVIKQYELVSLLYSNNYSSLEYALHHNHEHLYFYNTTGVTHFNGYTEILRDTPDNCNLIECPDSYYRKNERIVPYNYRDTTKSKTSLLHIDNVV
jgi:hypothetical protein